MLTTLAKVLGGAIGDTIEATKYLGREVAEIPGALADGFDEGLMLESESDKKAKKKAKKKKKKAKKLLAEALAAKAKAKEQEEADSSEPVQDSDQTFTEDSIKA